MPQTFKEFLAQEAERLGREEEVQKARREEWLGAVNRLFDQMEAWIADADASRVLHVRRRTVTKTEHALGRFDAPILELRLGATSVDIDPVAYRVVGPGLEKPLGLKSGGRVDLRSADQAYLLYRFTTDAGKESWVMVGDDGLGLGVLSRESFEAALIGLFQ
jgi:hypothetical protein